MFRTTLLSLLLALSTVDAAAESDPCVERLLQAPGSWKKYKNPERSARADLAVEKKTTTAIHDMLRSGYSPVGLVAYHGVGFSPSPHQPWDQWHYKILALKLLCDGDKFVTSRAGSTSLNVSFNLFGAGEIFDTLDDANGTGFHELAHGIPVEEKPGIWRFPVTPAGLGFGRTGKSDLWLLTYDGQLPWSYVTRKEFLQKRKANLATLMARSRTSLEETLAVIEQQKLQKEREYRDDPAKLERCLRVDYRPMTDRYQKLLADHDGPFLAAIADVERQLQQPASSLGQQAIVRTDPHDPLAYLFVEATDPMAKVLIAPNPAYFKKARRHVAQMVQVNLIWDHQDPIAVKFHDDVLAALDLDRIKAFVGAPAKKR